MTRESKLALLDKWSETRDKETFIKIGMELDPQNTREEMEQLFNASMAGYRQVSQTK